MSYNRGPYYFSEQKILQIKRKDEKEKEKENNYNELQRIFENIIDCYKKIISTFQSRNKNEKLYNLEKYKKNIQTEIKKVAQLIDNIIMKIDKELNEQNNNNELKEYNSLNDINSLKEINNKASPNIALLQKSSINNKKFEINFYTITSKNLEIIEEIEKKKNEFEDYNNLSSRNNYLKCIADLARDAHWVSYEIFYKLLQEFNKKNKFKSIIHERAKYQLSAWVGQCFGNSYHKKFFNTFCSQTIYYNNIERNIIDKNLKEHFKKIFINLCELYTEVLLFPEREIELIYIDKGIVFKYTEMKDITSLNKERYVNFTVIPGLFVNKKPIDQCKVLVFCEKKQKMDFNPDIKKINFPDEIILNNTIKSKDLSTKITVTFEKGYDKTKDIFFINIKTTPEIPKDDKPLFMILFFDKNINDWNCFSKQINKAEFDIYKQNINTLSKLTLSVAVQINNILITRKPPFNLYD